MSLHKAYSKLSFYTLAPVQFQRIEVEKSLEIEEEEHSDLLARHIIGTRIDDLSQLYTGKVIINGTLTLQNLQMAENKSRILVDNRQFDIGIADKYWMKSINQVSVTNFKNSIIV
jgi:hypothetical protein